MAAFSTGRPRIAIVTLASTGGFDYPRGGRDKAGDDTDREAEYKPRANLRYHRRDPRSCARSRRGVVNLAPEPKSPTSCTGSPDRRRRHRLEDERLPAFHRPNAEPPRTEASRRSTAPTTGARRRGVRRVACADGTIRRPIRAPPLLHYKGPTEPLAAASAPCRRAVDGNLLAPSPSRSAGRATRRRRADVTPKTARGAPNTPRRQNRSGRRLREEARTASSYSASRCSTR